MGYESLTSEPAKFVDALQAVEEFINSTQGNRDPWSRLSGDLQLIGGIMSRCWEKIRRYLGLTATVGEGC